MRVGMLSRGLPVLGAVALLCLVMGLAGGQRSIVWAATITVNTTVDEADADPGNGVCATSAGSCTLRAALQEANARSGPDTIMLSAGTYTLTIVGGDDNAATGDLDIRDETTIIGRGSDSTRVDGGAINRVFETWEPSSRVAIAHLTIQNGEARATQNGGGLLNRAQTTLDDVIVSNNRAEAGGGISVLSGSVTLNNVIVRDNETVFFGGGGIFNQSTLVLNDSIVSDNIATEDGGGIFNVGTLQLNDSALLQNRTFDGFGGGLNNDGAATLTRSTVSDNTAGGDSGGGGIRTGATLILNGTTVSGNSTSLRGGGILNSGRLTISNSTFSGNSADEAGGAIAHQGSGTFDLTSSTLTGNQGGIGGGIANSGGMIALSNTILAENSGSSPDCDGALTSLGHNLIGKNTSCVLSGAAGDQLGTIANPRDPKLGLLQNNGGPTLTHAPLAGSPAIDAGDNCPAVDQRGVVRPQDGNGDGTPVCDIGAYEIGAASPPTPSATSSGTSSTATPSQAHSRLLLPLTRRSLTPTPSPTASPTPTTEPPLACGEREPNEGPSDANPYPAFGRSCIGSFPGSGPNSDVNDWYWLNLNAGQTIRVSLKNIPAGDDYAIYLFGATAQNLLIYSNKSGSADETFTYTVGAQGRYHVQVFAWEKQAAIHSYVLHVGN